jgi:hypothetical protein
MNKRNKNFKKNLFPTLNNNELSLEEVGRGVAYAMGALKRLQWLIIYQMDLEVGRQEIAKSDLSDARKLGIRRKIQR